MPSASVSPHVRGTPGSVQLRLALLAGHDTAHASYTDMWLPVESVPTAHDSSHADTPGPLSPTKSIQPISCPPYTMRQDGSSTHGTQQSAAVHRPAGHTTSAVEIIAPALPVAWQLNPWHGNGTGSVAQERGVDVAGQEAWRWRPRHSGSCERRCSCGCGASELRGTLLQRFCKFERFERLDFFPCLGVYFSPILSNFNPFLFFCVAFPLRAFSSTEPYHPLVTIFWLLTPYRLLVATLTAADYLLPTA